MKKIFMIGLILISLIIISGCNGNKLDGDIETEDEDVVEEIETVDDLEDVKDDDIKTEESELSEFEKWKQDAPKDEAVQKTLKQCEDEMNKQISECETGMMDIMMSVSGMDKDFQEITPGGCEDPKARIEISTKMIDSQSLGESFESQVICSINCYEMECKKEIIEEEEVIEVKKCQQPPVRACYTECADLPSYPTYEKEDCIELCGVEDNAARNEYNKCVES